MKKLLLIDANSILHRMYHAIPPLSAPDGTPTNALYGTVRAIMKILSEHKPDYVAAAFDRPEPTFRKEEYEAYKAHRPPAHEDLVSQLVEARELFRSLGIAVCEKAGFEADDIIGTIASKYADKLEIVIFTGDLDSLQLVSEKVSVESFKKGVSETVRYTPDAVTERFGIPPERLPDFKGLTGDPSDNIPGVRGVGPKTASEILSKHETLEGFFESADENPKYRKIQEEKEIALLSKKLATIRRDVPIDAELESLIPARDEKKFSAYAEKMGFSSVIKKREPQSLFGESSGKKSAVPIPDPKRRKDGTLVGYNLKEYIKKTGAQGPHFDIHIAAWLLDPDKNPTFDEIAERFGTRDQETLTDSLSEALKREGVFRVFSEIEMPVLPVLAEMERKGILMDEAALLALKEDLEKERERAERDIFSEAGERFNILSPSQVSGILFEKIGIKTKKRKRTKTGMQSTSEGALSGLKRDYPIVSLILKYREYSKIISTYVDPLIERARLDKGVIHTSFLQFGTATGRFSSEKPNLQNIPQNSEWATPLRNCFVAREGKTFVSFDYSQLEIRILAHLSRDEKLIRVFSEGKDVHAATAANVFNVREEDVVPAMRRLAKTLNFGVIYGMGARAFSEESGITVEEAKRFIDEYFLDFPDVSSWREKVREEAKSGVVRNENGRVRLFPQRIGGAKGISEFERAAINMPIQSLEADILKIAMRTCFDSLALHNRNKDATMLLTIHDELIFEISDAILNETVPLIKKVMEESTPLSVPLIVDVRAGKKLGSMEQYEPN